MTHEGSDEAFDEYDEDNEAADESFEASDEADEAADEASDEADESYEAADEGSDEADEPVDEASDEAITDPITARMRALQDQVRRASFQSGLNRVASVEAKRAAGTRQAITQQLRAIRFGGNTRSQTVSRLQGGVVTATLANGRRARMSFSPRLAPLSEVNRLRATFNYNDKQQSAALATQRKALAGLAVAQAAAVSRLTSQQVKSDKDLANRIAVGHNRLDKRISTELASNKAALEKQSRRTMRALKQLRKRQLLNNVAIVTALPMFAAYSQKKLLSKNNAILTGSLAVSLLADEMIDQFTKQGKPAGFMSTAANAWSWAAPVINPLFDHFMLKDRQNERFLAKVVDVTGTSASLDLGVATDSVADFAKLTSVPAVVTVVAGGDAATVVTASVSAGKLNVSFLGGTVPVTKIAYMVDTEGTLT